MKRGIPSVLLVSDVFLALATAEATGYGCEEIPILVVKHPLGVRPADEVQRIGAEKAGELVAYFGFDGTGGR